VCCGVVVLWCCGVVCDEVEISSSVFSSLFYVSAVCVLYGPYFAEENASYPLFTVVVSCI